jgi:ElaB/YqjD/DUF883 family membrane-anchored ribosome-binding protein
MMDAKYRDDTSSRESKSQFDEELRSQGNSFINKGKEFASRELDQWGDAVHDASQRLHDKNDYLAQFADDLAGRLNSASCYIKEESADDLIRRADDFAHRHPALTIGGLLATGFVATRFLKIGSQK